MSVRLLSPLPRLICTLPLTVWPARSIVTMSLEPPKVNANTARNAIDGCNQHAAFRHLITVGINGSDCDDSGRITRHC